MILCSLLACAWFLGTAAHAQIGNILITGDDEEEGDAGSTSAGVPFEIGDTASGEFTGFREVIEKEELQQAGSSLAEVVADESGVQFKAVGWAHSAVYRCAAPALSRLMSTSMAFS